MKTCLMLLMVLSFSQVANAERFNVSAKSSEKAFNHVFASNCTQATNRALWDIQTQCSNRNAKLAHHECKTINQSGLIRETCEIGCTGVCDTDPVPPEPHNSQRKIDAAHAQFNKLATEYKECFEERQKIDLRIQALPSDQGRNIFQSIIAFLYAETDMVENCTPAYGDQLRAKNSSPVLFEFAEKDCNQTFYDCKYHLKRLRAEQKKVDSRIPANVNQDEGIKDVKTISRPENKFKSPKSSKQ